MEEVIRRSANYEASVWDDDYIQSLASPYMGKKYVDQAKKLKDLVRILIHETEGELDRLHLIDNHGYHVPQEVFCSLMDEEGNFKACLCEDVRGLVSLDASKGASEACFGGSSTLESAQARSQQELKRLSSWYKETGLLEKLGFVRHKLAECFFWALGLVPEHHLGYSREIVCKMAVLITIIDDIYDVYGTLEELQLFTHTIERWDINSLDSLPEYMKICFLALFNSVNELAYHVLRDQGFNVISNLRTLWAELCRAYYLEARWFHSGYVPTTNEYLNTAWISISSPLVLFCVYLATNPINEKELKSLMQYPGIIRWPSTVLRLADDLGTSSDEMKRGDVLKSIQCYMKETGCSEEDARTHVKHLIDTALKRMNKEILMENPIKNFGQIAMNLGPISLCIYQNGDGFGLFHSETKKNLVSLVVQPFPMP
ncbi:hypothetical protein AAHA92_29934 [Salvia divinorum]|uniref:Terpene synthase metal-binding domain-containing protein n=1 Tax=Salvia divinorum TaxID=28513 RepID=A0ABD1FZZ6_SALDI